MAASDDDLAYDNEHYFYEDDTVDGDLQEDETNDLPMFRQNYKVLTEKDLRQRIQDNIDEVSGVLSVSKPEASVLLRHYNWSVCCVFDAWFADETLVRERVGLFVKNDELSDDHDRHSGRSFVCGICFEDCRYQWLKSTYCGHLYCNDCWSSYIKTAIADGPKSLLLKCPEPSCVAAVREDMMGLFASEGEKKKYDGYIVTSYVESSKKIKWCPAPGCENAVDFVVGSESLDVSCLCSYSFCWNCSEEAHRPVDCGTVSKWLLKNNSESENMNYILAFTKPCPKCKKPIEKNHGCNHMTCRAPCGYQFCWLCLEDWVNHGTCNRFKGNYEEQTRERAKKYVMKYTHYFERWATNKKSMKKAAADLKNVQTEQIEIVARIQVQSSADISFIREAWQQIIECRRVLTWTYAYGYYLPEECEAKRNLFEYFQGQAESGLERLHDFAEKELLPFLKDKRSNEEFVEFRTRLTLLTKVTGNFFDNLVTALQNGLSDVNSEGSSSGSEKRKPVSTVRAPRIKTIMYDHSAEFIDTFMEEWPCEYCSYINQTSATSCEMCSRGSWTCDVCTYANSSTSTTCEMCSDVV